MGVATTYKKKMKAPAGVTLWHNPTKKDVLVRLNNGTQEDFRLLEPGESDEFPVWLTDKMMKRLAPQLVKGPAPKGGAAKAKPKPPAPVVDDTPTEPLGDGSQPRTVEDDAGNEIDSERTSEDALEAFAQDLEGKHSLVELKEMAETLGVATGGRKIDVARRLAKKMSE